MGDLLMKLADGDEIHARLCAAIEVEETRYLWVPADAITFVPRVLPRIYGDGRALFTIGTINQRPAYWVVRGCSTWGCGFDREDAAGPDFADLTDDILTELEDAFGRGTCGYSGSSLFHPRADRIQGCRCEECEDEIVSVWPEVNGNDGCHWDRMDWPKTFETVPNPLSWRGNLLAEDPDRPTTGAGDRTP